MSKQRKTRFPLLPYKIIAKRWRLSSLLLVPGGAGVYWALPRLIEGPLPLHPLTLVISAVGLLLFLYTLAAGRAHVSCEDNRFVIHTPLYPVAFSYARIEMIRSSEFGKLFPPQEEKNARWRLYHDLWGKTVPTVTLKGYPLPLGWLKLWFHPYLFHPKETGLVMPVEDWMGFIRTLETNLSAWRETKRR